MKGFVISWFFPPINSSEGLVTFKLLKRSGIKHDVFSQNNNSNWSYNISEHYLTHKNIKPIFGSSNSYDIWMNECLDYFENSSGKYDFIMSRSMPPESHKAALLIKEKYPNIKWIASFGDPIANSPYNRLNQPKPLPKLSAKKVVLLPLSIVYILIRFIKGFVYNHGNINYPLCILRNVSDRIICYRSFHSKERESIIVENITILNADVIIFNSKYQMNYMLDKYSDNIKQKGVVIPHPFDVDFYSKKVLKKENNEKITISFVGHLDTIRNPKNFFKALEKMKRLKPDNYNKIDVRFYGTMDEMSRLYILDNNLYDVVSINQPVKYLESLEIMQKSDWCLHIDANLSNIINDNIYFAAKIADYIGSGSNIFGISMMNGASADIIRKTGGILSSHSVDEIFMYLNLIAESKINNKPKNTDEYNSINTAKEYDKIVKNMINNPKS